MSKRNKIIYWIATIWMATGMVSTGIVQLLEEKGGQGGGDSMEHLGYPHYLLPLLGFWKILGIIALLIPKFTLLKEWAYAGFFFVMSGAVYSHVAVGEPLKTIPAATLLILTVVSWYFRPVNRKIALPVNRLYEPQG